MVAVEDLFKVFQAVTKVVQGVILFMIPIYLAIGKFFAVIALAFIHILPSGSFVAAIIIASVIGVGGLVGGIFLDPARKKPSATK